MNKTLMFEKIDVSFASLLAREGYLVFNDIKGLWDFSNHLFWNH